MRASWMERSTRAFNADESGKQWKLRTNQTTFDIQAHIDSAKHILSGSQNAKWKKHICFLIVTNQTYVEGLTNGYLKKWWDREVVTVYRKADICDDKQYGQKFTHNETEIYDLNKLSEVFRPKKVNRFSAQNTMKLI